MVTVKEKKDRYRMLGNVMVSCNSKRTHLNNNDCIIGNSGAGKTTSYVIPYLKDIEEESAVVSDTKGNLYRKMKRELESKGYIVKLLDFYHPDESCGYNPLKYVSYKMVGDIEYYNESEIKKIADTICPVLVKRDPFWEKSAAMILESMIAFVLESLPVDEHNLCSVVKLFESYTKENFKEIFSNLQREDADSIAVRKYHMYEELSDADKTYACVKQFLAERLNGFSNRELENVFMQKDDFRISDLGKKKMVLFVNQSDTDRSMDAIINVFWTQALQELVKLADENKNSRLDVPVRLLMDDFACTCYIKGFDRIASAVRSREISFSIILQNISQLFTMYSESEAETIMGNCVRPEVA